MRRSVPVKTAWSGCRCRNEGLELEHDFWKEISLPRISNPFLRFHCSVSNFKGAYLGS